MIEDPDESGGVAERDEGDTDECSWIGDGIDVGSTGECDADVTDEPDDTEVVRGFPPAAVPLRRLDPCESWW